MSTRNVRFLVLLLCCVVFAAPVKANTVNFYLQDIGDLEISAFQLFFDETNLPVDFNWDTFTGDFAYEWGVDQETNKPLAWDLESLIRSEDEVDFARGIGGSAPTLMNTVLKLQEGLVLTMSSRNTDFAIDIDNLSNGFFDFALPNGEPIDLILSETWLDGNQTVIASAVPIPSSLLLLGGGLMGLMAYRRRK